MTVLRTPRTRSIRWRRLGVRVGGAAVVGLVALAAPGPWAAASPLATPAASRAAAPSRVKKTVDQQRAISSYQALQRYLYLSGYQLYRTSTTNSQFGTLWPFGNAMAGTDYLVAMPGGSGYAADLAARLQGLMRYRNDHEVDRAGNPAPPAFASAVMPPLGTGGDTYYDDNGWAALALIHQYRLTGEAGYLTLARQTFDFAVTGWSGATNVPCPGGVYWVDKPTNGDRNTVSTASNAEVAAELYSLTGVAGYLTWAERLYGWVDTCLRAPDGLYYDKIRGDGSTDTTTWSYNQGIMIGAGVLLSAATGDRAYLDGAQVTAERAVAYYGTGSVLRSQGAAFNGIYFRNLLLLNQVAPGAAYASQARSYADYMWSNQRDSRTGLFQPNTVNGTAPMVEIYALLAGSPPEGGPFATAARKGGPRRP